MSASSLAGPAGTAPDDDSGKSSPADGGDGGGSGGRPGDQPTAARMLGLRWWHEVAFIVLVYVAYSAVRNQFGSGAGSSIDADPAFHHGEAIIQLERNMRLYFEEALQRWYLDLPGHGLIRFWNVYYGIFHFLVTGIALVWCYRAAPWRYRVWRNTLAATTLVALVGFASFSLMPPRLMDDPGIYGGCRVYAAGQALPDAAGDPPCDEFGFVDTIAVYGGWASFGSDEMAAVSNQYAAMPSMHIGWSTWCALVMVPLIRRRWLKVLAAAYPLFTLFCIIVTANHYWIDGLGGLACLAVGYALSRWLTGLYERRYHPEAGALAAQPAVPVQ